MRLFITGATGLIGRRLVLDRLERGDQVVLLSRDAHRAALRFAAAANRNITVVSGDPTAPGQWQQHIAGCDAIVNLAGAGVADRRWTAAYKRELIDSRVQTTRNVVEAMAHLAPAQRPRVLINASAVGYYGHRGEQEIDEQTGAGPSDDFLAQLCVQWEAQALEAASLGVRVVLLRTGVVLDALGGALPTMLKPFRVYVGGSIGSGRQFMPWIHWRDLVGLIDLALEREAIEGPLNAVAPEAVRNRDFSALLGLAVGKPSWLPVPKLALRAVLGEVAKYIAASQRIKPAKALAAGYVFLYPQLEAALDELLGEDDLLESEAASAMEQSPFGALPRMNLGPPPLLAAAAAPSPQQQAATPSAPIKLLAIDVDGTLLRNDGSLPQGVVQACRAASRAGCAVVLATARPPRAMRAIMQAIDVPAPLIAYNGAAIWDPQGDRAQHHEPLPGELARQIIEAARALKPEILVCIEVLDHWFTDRLDSQFLSVSGRMMEPDEVAPLERYLGEPLTKINLLGRAETIQPVLELVRERFWKPRAVAMFLSDPHVIQIAHPMVDKGIALQRIARRLGVQREQVMAIGDAGNDAGMIEWAGFGVAVANAYPSVLRLADAVVPSNEELGVARAIQRFVLARR